MRCQSAITVNVFILQILGVVGFSAAADEVGFQVSESVAVSPIAVHVNDQTNTAVAYGTVRDEFLVVYEHEYSATDHDIYGRRVGSDGVPIANEIGIFTDASSDFDPAVAYNPLSDEYLVVWEHEYSATDHDIYGWRLAADGGLVGPAHVSTLSASELNPRVVHNPVTDEYLVVWQSWQGSHHDVNARRMAADGTLLGAEVIIADGIFNQAAPAVAVDAATGTYLIVWEEETTPGNYDVLGRLMAADGSLPGGVIAVSTWSNDQLRPDVAFNPAAGSFLVVWEDHHWGTGADPDIYGQLVAGNGGLLGGNIAISWDSPNDRLNPAVTYLSATQEFLVVWEYEYSVSDHDVYRRRVAGDGQLVEDEKAVSALGHNEARPQLAASGGLSFLTVWEDDRDNATSGIDIYGGLEELKRIEGNVFDGEEGDETSPLEGVTVELYCSDEEPSLGTLLSTATTNGSGWYGLTTGTTCEYYNIVELDPDGYASIAATSVDGTVLSHSWIQYVNPLDHKVLIDNKFWDADTDPPPENWTSFSPSGWTGDQTPDCSIQVEDQVSGLDPTSAFYEYSIDGGATWSGWIPASCTGAAGSLGPETVTAVGVPFGQDSGPSGPNLIRFRISDMADQSSISGDFAAAVDSAPPTVPPSLLSTSHTPGVWSNAPSVSAQWNPASDSGSGVAGYSIQWDHLPVSDPDLSVDTTAVVHTSSPLADAVNWYLHVRAIDEAGNGSSSAAHLGPFLIDTVPPSSSVASLDPWQGDVFIDVSWGGSGGAGSAIVSYDVQVLDEVGGNQTVIGWLTGTTFTQYTFTGARGHRYSFSSRARDAAGNVESYPVLPDATTTVGRDAIVWVRDESGAPVSGAKVYFEGDYLGLTNGAGTITAPSALVGDEIIALSQVHEEPAVKPAHSNHGSSNWAWRAYQTSLGFTPAGDPLPHTVGDIHATQQLTVRRDRALIGFHMVVSVQFDATPAFLDNLRQGLEIASDFLYDVGDGQFFFEVVEVFDNGAFFASGCDMEVHASINGRANAHVTGITGGVDQHINLARHGEQITNSWAVGSGARIMIHEVGHYGLHLYDEYLARDNVSSSFCATDFDSTPVDRRASIMFDQNETSEMCTDVDPNHQHRSQTQHDAQTGGETTWETTQRVFSDSTSPERWTILTPDDRSAVMPGPDGLPISSWTQVYVTDADSGACAPFTVTLVENGTGAPAAQAKIWLDRPFPQSDLVQGHTNAAGQIEIVGAHDGDILRAKKGGLEGSTTVSCVQMAGRDSLNIEPTGFDLDVAVVATGEDAVRIDVAASEPLAAGPTVELWQAGSAATTDVTMSYIPALGLYTGQVVLDGSLQAGGSVSALATDQGGHTVTALREFELHEVTTDGAAEQVYSPDGNLELVFPTGSLAMDAVVSIGTVANAPPTQDALLRVGSAYDVSLSEGSLVG
ncbi:MAG: prealbumin-like fold domain-containing protein, partial [Candidatus Sulfomarinibacteraceae bacterium]